MALAPLRRVRVDLVDLRYAPIVRDAKGNRAPKRVIHGCTTSFLPGTVSALMGPSGSGKTSLLTVIAGFVDQSHVSGNLLVNGERTQVGKRLVGIVFQDDMMLPALTAFETVKFAADLRMPRRCSDAERCSTPRASRAISASPPLASATVGKKASGSKKLPEPS